MSLFPGNSTAAMLPLSAVTKGESEKEQTAVITKKPRFAPRLQWERWKWVELCISPQRVM